MSANISPLAQTFKVSEEFPQGCVITSVDLFFAAKGTSDPVEVQIVETLNGYPTNNVLIKSLVYPENINANPTGLTATKFKLPNLLKLQPGTEYAIKVLTNSMQHKVWTAIMGQPRIDNPAVLITQQPALGSLFKSQNNSTWTAEQTQDLAFVLNRAKFDTNVTGKVNLVESPTSEYLILPSNPFKITTGSTTVKVAHTNHGLDVNMYVRYIDSNATQFNDISFKIVKVINSDHYMISLGTASTATDRVGGNDVKTEKVVRFDTLRVFGIIEGRDVGAKVTARLSSSSGIDTTDTNITVTEYKDLALNKYVHSSVNRSSLLGGANSFTLKTELTSTNNAMSPLIPLNQIIVQLLGNKVNSPSVVNDVDYTVDEFVVATGTSTTPGTTDVIFAASPTNTIQLPATTDFSRIKLGAWIKVVNGPAGVGSYAGTNLGKTGYISAIDTTARKLTIVGDSLLTEASTIATIAQYTSYVSELFSGGTAESKHITKQVNLDNACTGFRVILQANVYTDADIQLYYRTGAKSSATKLSDSGWTNYPITYKKTANETEFTEYTYDIANLKTFDEFQFKFVFLSTNSAVTSRIKNLRIIAHA